MQQYKAKAGQSIYDVCLQTYGSLDYLGKLMDDNGINGVDEDVLSGQVFEWDDQLIVDQGLNLNTLLVSDTYATAASKLGSVFFAFENNNPTVGGGSTPIAPPPPPTQTTLMTLGTYFTSNADNTTVVNVTDINGNPIIGCDVIQVEKETKPLKNIDWVWNKTSSTLTLINGVTVDNEQTLFILYNKTA